MPHHNPALTTPAAPPRQAWSLIRRVARSFALSLQVLPPVMRWPVALAYVLARASDTVADAPIAGHPGPASAQMRLQALQELRAAFQGARGTAQVQTTQSSLVALISELAPSSERTLLELVPAWLTALHQLPAKEQRLISEVCTTIIDGQQTDLQRFPAAQLDAEQVKALATTLEMDEYTWQVAGCVGRFWCLICEAHLPG